MFISLILAAIGWRCAVSFVKFAIVMDLRLIKRAEKLLSLDLAELTLALLTHSVLNAIATSSIGRNQSFKFFHFRDEPP